MALLNRLFASAEVIAKEIKLDADSIARNWQSYAETVTEKEQLINKLPFLFGEKQKSRQRLKELLDLELVDVRDIEGKKEEIIRDLKSIEHSKQIKRVQRLKDALGYVETKYEYVYGLLEQLFKILITEAILAERLSAPDLRKYREIVQLMKNQLELEKEIIKKIEGVKTFHKLFIDLVKREHIVKTMDKKEKRMLSLIEKRMKAIFTNKINEKITYNWAINVFNAVEDKLSELHANFALESYDFSDFEFVNKPEFVDLVREEIKKLRPREVSDRMIAVFVHAFREWYNHQRD